MTMYHAAGRRQESVKDVGWMLVQLVCRHPEDGVGARKALLGSCKLKPMLWNSLEAICRGVERIQGRPGDTVRYRFPVAHPPTH
jgi:hypothetical protein